MDRYAHVNDNGDVVNICLWDGETEYNPSGVILIKDDGNARMGGSWDGNAFTFVEPDPAPDTRSYDEKRREAYNAAGCTMQALTIATFESVFADDSSAAVRLQVEREKIKAAIPK